MTKKRAKNMYINRDNPKTGTFYPINKFLTDDHGNKYQLYHRNKLQFFKDIPLNDTDIGIVVDGYFCRCFSSHPYAYKSFNQNLERINHLIDRDNVNLLERSKGLISRHKGARK